MLPAPTIDCYKHIGGSDSDAQQRACGSPAPQRDVRYWWSIFCFMLEAYMLNAFSLFQLDHPKSKLTNRELRWHCAMSLRRSQAGQSKLKKIPELTRKRETPGPAHEREHLPKKRHCTVCTKGRTKRKPFGANSGKRRRLPLTVLGDKHPGCKGKAICKPECWEGAHKVDLNTKQKQFATIPGLGKNLAEVSHISPSPESRP